MHHLPSSPWLVIPWVSFWIIASLLYRRSQGKPIFNPPPPHPAFLENWASGRSLRNPLTRLGRAKNCLQVIVTDRTVHVAVHFPLNLMFLPEIYGTEFTTPATSIRSVEQKAGILSGKFIRLTLARPAGRDEQFDLYLKNPQAFLQAIATIRQPTVRV